MSNPLVNSKTNDVPTNESPNVNKYDFDNNGNSNGVNEFIQSSREESKSDLSDEDKLSDADAQANTKQKNDKKITDERQKDQGINPAFIIDKDDKSDGVNVCGRSPREEGDDLSDLSFENGAKGAPPLVNEQNKNELSRKRPATEKEKGSTSVHESGKIYLSKNIHGIGVKKLRLQNDDDDERTESSETQSSSEAESSIDTIGNQKNETFKVDDYKFRFIIVGATPNSTCCAYASIKDHPIRKQQMKRFQFDDNGNVKDESKETVKDLILFSKKVWLTNKVMKDCYEGMYGFIGEKHLLLVKNTTTIYETKYPLIW